MSGNIVHIRRPINGIIGYGHTRPKVKRKFNENLRSVFLRNVVDPIKLTPAGFSNTCVIVNIIIKLEYIMRGTLEKTRIKHIKEMLKGINLGNIDVLQQGITIEQFQMIENMDQPFKFLQKHYGFLRKYEGFSLNIFSCKYSKTLRSYSLVAIKLSERWNQSKFFSIDLLRDSEDIRAPIKNKKKKIFNKPLHQYEHTLIIINIFRMFQSFKEKNHNSNRYGDCQVCRR